MDKNNLFALLPELAVFATVAELQSFSAAGRTLGVAPSSVSRSVTRLENSLQTRLLERTTRQVRLSAAGAEVYRQCQDMLGAAQAAVQAAQSQQVTPSGLLRIAAPKAFAQLVLAPVVFEFMAAYPEISVKLRVSDREVDPISDEVDAVFRLTDQPAPGLVGRALGRVRLVLCASPAYLQQQGTPQQPSELAQHRCIPLGEHAGDEIWSLNDGESECSVRVSGPLAVNHSEIRKQAVLLDHGIGVFPDFTVREALRTGQLVAVLQHWSLSGNYQGQVFLQYAPTRFQPAPLRAFIDFVTQRLTL